MLELHMWYLIALKLGCWFEGIFFLYWDDHVLVYAQCLPLFPGNMTKVVGTCMFPLVFFLKKTKVFTQNWSSVAAFSIYRAFSLTVWKYSVEAKLVQNSLLLLIIIPQILVLMLFTFIGLICSNSNPSHRDFIFYPGLKCDKQNECERQWSL